MSKAHLLIWQLSPASFLGKYGKALNLNNKCLCVLVLILWVKIFPYKHNQTWETSSGACKNFLKNLPTHCRTVHTDNLHLYCVECAPQHVALLQVLQICFCPYECKNMCWVSKVENCFICVPLSPLGVWDQLCYGGLFFYAHTNEVLLSRLILLASLWSFLDAELQIILWSWSSEVLVSGSVVFIWYFNSMKFKMPSHCDQRGIGRFGCFFWLLFFATLLHTFIQIKVRRIPKKLHN